MTQIDYAARLALVQAAINALLTDAVKAYTIDGMSVQKVDLPQLVAEESRLLAKVQRAARAGGAFRQAAPQ